MMGSGRARFSESRSARAHRQPRGHARHAGCAPSVNRARRVTVRQRARACLADPSQPRGQRSHWVGGGRWSGSWRRGLLSRLALCRFWGPHLSSPFSCEVSPSTAGDSPQRDRWHRPRRVVKVRETRSLRRKTRTQSRLGGVRPTECFVNLEDAPSRSPDDARRCRPVARRLSGERSPGTLDRVAAAPGC
jgi:hypothetical protein